MAILPAVVLLLGVAALATRAQQLVNNPSFEDSSSDLSDWNSTMNGGGCGVNTGSGSGGQLASAGSNNAYLFPANTLSQWVSSVAGAVYRLAFDAYSLYEWEGDPAQTNLQVSLRPQGAPGWDDQSDLATYLSVPNGTSSAGPYAHFAINLTAQGGDLLSFAYASGTHSTLGSNYSTALRIDNITLTFLSDASSSSSTSASPQTSAGSGSSSSGDDGTTLPTKVGHQASPGLIAACGALGAVALAAAAYALVVTRRRAKGDRNQKEEWSEKPMTTPLFAPTTHSPSQADHFSTQTPPQTGQFSTTGTTSYARSNPACSTTHNQSTTPRLPPEIQEQQRAWNPYEQDTYEGYGRSS